MKNKEDKKKEALARAKEHSSLTPAQKLVKLDLKFGAGQGAVKERAKIAAQIEAAKTAPAVEAKPKEQKKPYQKPKKS